MNVEWWQIMFIFKLNDNFVFNYDYIKFIDAYIGHRSGWLVISFGGVLLSRHGFEFHWWIFFNYNYFLFFSFCFFIFFLFFFIFFFFFFVRRWCFVLHFAWSIFFIFWTNPSMARLSDIIRFRKKKNKQKKTLLFLLRLPVFYRYVLLPYANCKGAD